MVYMTARGGGRSTVHMPLRHSQSRLTRGRFLDGPWNICVTHTVAKPRTVSGPARLHSGKASDLEEVARSGVLGIPLLPIFDADGHTRESRRKFRHVVECVHLMRAHASKRGTTYCDVSLCHNTEHTHAHASSSSHRCSQVAQSELVLEPLRLQSDELEYLRTMASMQRHSLLAYFVHACGESGPQTRSDACQGCLEGCARDHEVPH